MFNRNGILFVYLIITLIACKGKDPDPIPIEITIAPPSSLTAEFESLSSVKLSWIDNANNETSYIIYKSLGGEYGLFSPMEELTLSANTTFESINNLAPCEQFWFKVIATDGTHSSAFSNAVLVDTQIAAKITISNSSNSPLISGTFNIQCFDFDTENGALGLLDLNNNGQIDSKTGADPGFVFPRQPYYDGNWLGTWELKYGNKCDGNANLVLLTKFSTWTTQQRPQFVALHLDLNTSTGDVSPVSIFAGDLSQPNDGSYGIVMANLFESPPSLFDIGGVLPIAGNGFINGNSVCNVFFRTPDEFTTYAATIKFEFNTPIYPDQ